MENIVTSDLSEFGYRELKIAGQLLSTLKTDKDKTRFIDEGLTVFFNKKSGYVFLSDENFNVAMMNGDILEDFINCPDCGNEALVSEFNAESDCCKEFLEAIA
jgi:hypothetical protein